MSLGAVRSDQPLTAYTRGYADNEELIGKWFARTGKRDEVRHTNQMKWSKNDIDIACVNQIFLATKFAVKMGPGGQRDIRNDPEYIRMAVDRSLKNLQTDRIDLWYW